MGSFDIEEARENLRKRRERTAKEREKLFLKATADCEAIIGMITQQFKPRRIYQWGSLLQKEMFTDYSDIDIAWREWDRSRMSWNWNELRKA